MPHHSILYNFRTPAIRFRAGVLFHPMQLKIFGDKVSLAQAAAVRAAAAIRRAIRERGKARIVAATGAAQFDFLDVLTKDPDIDWDKVTAFHLDEYIGIPKTHRASFNGILMERLVSKTKIIDHYFLVGDASNIEAMIREVGELLVAAPIDIAFVGIGENGHIAFNDPPANFETEQPYIIVTLDEQCRRQQVGEGWFADLSQVPTRAISMSARQVLKANEIIAIVPDLRKAQAVKACFSGKITPMAPASILRTHANATIYLDKDSASLLTPDIAQKFSEELRTVETL
jgi:glucosamine-6-phosphate deaminase